MAKCRHKKLILVTAWIDRLIPDQEPYESGVEEAMDDIDVGVELVGHYCPKCMQLNDIKIEEMI